MKENKTSNNQQELMKKALNELRSLRSQIRDLQYKKTEPVAILGIGCRFPGSCDSPDDFWQLLNQGVDAVSEVPKNRFLIDKYYDPDPDAPGKIYTKNGGFLGDVDNFDADFFDMTPREVISLDPKQRVLMEVTWEALENANIPSDSLYGESAGVFFGMSSYDFMMKQAKSLCPEDIDAYFSTGNAQCVASGRISYLLGLTGPCMSVDTACSSSLLSVHLACQSLRNNECNIALAGGINLILAPEISINFSRAKMLSRDGRCKTFDNSADGYGRGEGCGVIVLKRLSDAISQKDNILAVIKGSATNQDGPSGGLTVPNGPAQQAVIKEALKNADVTPDEISYIEAHGTGTSLGDPIEISALGNVFANHQKNRPLIVGSVKTNIGHLESASGIAGLIKVVLSLGNNQIPKHLHLRSLNRHVDWNNLPIKIPESGCDWPSGYEKRLAGVSSFGFSGSNVHLVLEEAPPKKMMHSDLISSDKTDNYYIYTISAKTQAALNDLKIRHRQYLIKNPKLDPENLSYTSCACRTHFQHRMSMIYKNSDELIDFINENLSQTSSTAAPPEPAFLFTGQGSQYVGMGKDLYQLYPIFKDVVDQCCDILRSDLSVPLLDVMGYTNESGNPDLLNSTAYTQPALFVIEYALARLWKSWNITPAIVLGHSVGEYVAACVAGIFSLEDGLHLIAKRASLMQKLPENGGMAAVFADELQVKEWIKEYGDEIAVAAVNGPENIVISGKNEIMTEVCSDFEARGIQVIPLKVSHAFHSPLMNQILSDFEQVAETITYHKPQIRIVSNVTGNIVLDEMSNHSYWVNHIIRPVQFSAGMSTLYREGFRLFLEVGPKPILSGMGALCLPGAKIKWLPSMTPNKPMHRLMQTLGELYVQGADIDWKELFPSIQRDRITLPSYPFQRKRYRPKALDHDSINNNIKHDINQTIHPLLGTLMESPLDEIQFKTKINSSSSAFIAHHKVLDNVVMPASGFIEMMIASAQEVFGPDQPISINILSINKGLFIGKDENISIQVILSPDDNSSYQCRIFSKSNNLESRNNRWQCNTSARLSQTKYSNEKPQLSDLKNQISSEISVRDLYEKFKYQGLNYGHLFQAVQQAWKDQDKVLGKIELPGEIMYDSSNYYLHPVISDACFQLIQAVMPEIKDAPTYLPVSIENIRFYRQLNETAWGYAHMTTMDSQKVVADLTLFDETGNIAAEIIGFTAGRVEPWEWLAIENKILDIKWVSAPISPSIPENIDFEEFGTENWLICSNPVDFAKELIDKLEFQGATCTLLSPDAINEQSLNKSLTGIVYHADNLSCSNVESRQQPEIESLLNLVQLSGTMSRQFSPRLWIITSGAQWLENHQDQCNPYQTAQWGFGRVLLLEHPELKCSMLDLDPSSMTRDITQVAQILLSPDNEDQMAWRDGNRFVPRLIPHDAPSGDKNFRQNIRAVLSDYGSLDNLSLIPFTHPNPKPDEIEIEVKASGLNFRDVLHALGMVKSEGYEDNASKIPFGFECSGIVNDVGSRVKHFQRGQSVIAVLAPGSMGSRVNVRAEFAYPMPDQMSFEAAATIPLVFLTAWHGLCKLAKLGAKLGTNETILIHAASGGVGLAAVQIAKFKGANIIATASPAKWDRLKEMGIRHVMNSRALDFAEEIMKLTDGNGIDVVLNSLTGEFITKSLGVLKHGGRFIEIGKTGILNDQQVHEIRPDVDYFAFDLGKVGNAEPESIQSMFNELMPEFEKGNLKSLPYKDFPMEEMVDGFRYMAQTKHFGKVVITMPKTGHGSEIDSHATYVITGGTGALGSLLTKWLIKKGASHIVLVSRHPGDNINNIPRTEKVQIILKSCDVSSDEQLTNLFDDIKQSLPPVKGVIHGAGVLDDGVIMEQTRQRFESVMKPKISGAWNLHRTTQSLDLDFFIMFSSSTSILGNAGQSNYAVANAFLDGLAHYRRSLGLPGTSINWGPWGESGMAVSQSELEKKIAAKGIKSLSPDDALTMLETIMRENLSQACVVDIDWETYGRTQGAQSPMFLNQHNKTSHGTGYTVKAGKGKLKNLLIQAPPDQRESLLVAHLKNLGKKIAGYEDNRDMDDEKPLMDAGFDSLMAVEFRNILNQKLNESLPASLLFDYPTLKQIALFILNEALMLPIEEDSLEDLSADDVMGEITDLLN